MFGSWLSGRTLDLRPEAEEPDDLIPELAARKGLWGHVDVDLELVDELFFRGTAQDRAVVSDQDEPVLSDPGKPIHVLCVARKLALQMHDLHIVPLQEAQRLGDSPRNTVINEELQARR